MTKCDPQKVDMRIIRTVSLLKAALIDLLKTTPYDRISVTDVCDKALVHRTTFYKHFENKEQLLLAALEDQREEIFGNLGTKKLFESPKEIYMYIAYNGFDYLARHRTSVLAIYRNLNNDDAFNAAKKGLERSIRYLFLHNRPFKNYPVPVNIMTTFYTGGMINLILWWLNNDGSYSTDEVLKYVNMILSEENCG